MTRSGHAIRVRHLNAPRPGNRRDPGIVSDFRQAVGNARDAGFDPG
ncbi:hypothetical protein LNQ52_23415 [Klebsiella pneumoniae subsp. pneumoniae]|nr:hypothetical protein [Klebsiella pneumoniae subsp. pneumoniae]